MLLQLLGHLAEVAEPPGHVVRRRAIVLANSGPRREVADSKRKPESYSSRFIDTFEQYKYKYKY